MQEIVVSDDGSRESGSVGTDQLLLQEGQLGCVNIKYGCVN
jgi:hypothetical protein